jgi:hypothetical protein
VQALGKRSPTKKKGQKVAEDLSVVAQPAEFFKQEITKALQNQKVAVDPDTEFYLVDLLSRFMITRNLYAADESGAMREEVLALLLGEAMSAPDSVRRHRGLRRLGDVSLYTAGFFSDSLSRKIVDVDYYIGMGRNAYGSLAQSGFDSLLRKVFIELSQRFDKFVDVLAEISDASSMKDAKNILRLYEVWLRTGSRRAEKNLKEAGIIPNLMLKPEWQ